MIPSHVCTVQMIESQTTNQENVSKKENGEMEKIEMMGKENKEGERMSMEKKNKIDKQAELQRRLKMVESKKENYDFSGCGVVQDYAGLPPRELVPPFVEWIRFNVVRSLRWYFEYLNKKLLRKMPVRESFNRWLYLQLALPSGLQVSTSFSSELKKRVNDLFAFANISANGILSGDPVLRYPSCASSTDVIKSELKAELVVRCDKINFGSMSFGKIKTLFLEYTKGMMWILQNWLGISWNACLSYHFSPSSQIFKNAYVEFQKMHSEYCRFLDQPLVISPLLDYATFESLLNECMSHIRVATEVNLEHARPHELGSVLTKLRSACIPFLEVLFNERIDCICLMLEKETYKLLSIFKKVLETGVGATANVVSHSHVTVQLKCSKLILKPLFKLEETIPSLSEYLEFLGETDWSESQEIVLDSISISLGHYEKLKTLFILHNLKIAPQLLSDYLYSLLRRYQTLQDSLDSPLFKPHIASETTSRSYSDREGVGFHAAAPEGVFRVLSKAGVNVEVFASPLNCFLGRFCSAFYDVDSFFGSNGSFFDFQPASGCFECNPPFTIEVMDATALYLNLLLRSSSQPLSFAVIVPNWNDPPANYIKTLENSPFIRFKVVIPSRQHKYILGSQQFISATEESRYFSSVHDTLFYLLQNNEGAKKWPFSADICSNIQKSFQ